MCDKDLITRDKSFKLVIKQKWRFHSSMYMLKYINEH